MWQSGLWAIRGNRWLLDYDNHSITIIYALRIYNIYNL